MKILSIDTASNLCTVAVLEDTVCEKSLTINDTRNHSEKIMPAIEQILLDSNLTLNDIDLIVCDKGPGSFTGIRIGIGTVLAFKDSLSIPCVGISSLEALAYNVKNEGLICSLIDAKNQNVYFGLFKLENGNYIQIEDLEFKNIENVISSLIHYSSVITFVGDGALIYQKYLEENLPYCIFCKYNDLSSISLGIAGYNTYKNKVSAPLVPMYLRKSQAERAIEEKGGKI